MNDTPSLNEKLSVFRTCPAEEIGRLVSNGIPHERLPAQYLQSLSKEDRTVCFRASMICWTISGSTMVPREMQLRVVLANYHGKDTLVAAGTGSGKTLPIAISILLDDPAANTITLTISPLKWLQVTQESDFNTRFGIPTVVINEDTPREADWWNVSIDTFLDSTLILCVQKNVFDTTTHRVGTARHLIVTVEQLFKSSAGHLRRLGTLIREHQDFQRRIVRINVDEAHFIRTTGMPLYGNPAFRPAWGKLDELKAILPDRVCWNAFSATFPPHILKTVTKKILRPDHISIQVSSNRANTVYATHQVYGSIEDVRNYECFISEPFDFSKQPHFC